MMLSSMRYAAAEAVLPIANTDEANKLFLCSASLGDFIARHSIRLSANSKHFDLNICSSSFIKLIKKRGIQLILRDSARDPIKFQKTSSNTDMLKKNC